MSEHYNSSRLLIYDDKGNLLGCKLILAVPGITKDKVEVSYLDEILYVNIEEHYPATGEFDKITLNNVTYDAAKYEFSINGLDLAKTDVKVENGLITIFVPVMERKLPKTNKIKIS